MMTCLLYGNTGTALVDEGIPLSIALLPLLSIIFSSFFYVLSLVRASIPFSIVWSPLTTKFLCSVAWWMWSFLKKLVCSIQEEQNRSAMALCSIRLE